MANGFALVIADLPDNCVFDPKSFASAANANAAIVGNVALFFNGLQQPIAVDLGKGFGGEARGECGELLPVKFPEVQGCLVAVVENRIFGGVVGNNDKVCIEQVLSLDFDRGASID